MLLLACLAAVPGCGLFRGARNSSATDRPNFAEKEKDRSDRLPAQPFDKELTKGSGGNSRGTLLAGQVIDSFNNRLPRATIVIQSQDGSNTASQPREVQTDDQGFFTIYGLESGKKYKLQAKARTGEVIMTGNAEVAPPNSVVLIKLAQETRDETGKSVSNPSPYGGGSIGGMHRSIMEETGTSADNRKNNPNEYLYERDTGPIRPRTDNEPPKLGKPVIDKGTEESRPPIRPEYITRNDEAGTGKPLVMSIPPFPNGQKDLPGTSVSRESNPMEFPLLDLEQKPVRIAQYKGKLTLIDVWSTNCPPCIKALPSLVELDRKYKAQGLSIVGLVIDEKGTANEVTSRVRFFTDKAKVSYPILREDAARPFSVSFEVHSIPTLLLVDEQGKIILRLTGLTNEAKLQLEQEIGRRLGS